MPENSLCFVDTNVWLYALIESEDKTNQEKDSTGSDSPVSAGGQHTGHQRNLREFAQENGYFRRAH